MITAAQAIVKCLEAERVSVVYGYPGAAICPVYDALSFSDIKHVLVRQEQNAAHAANGYARMSGRPGVCIATSGPGALNLITGIATAYADSIPLVVLTGQVSTDQLGKDVFQEADITGAAEPFVKHSYLVKEAAQIPRILKEAFHIAGTGRPGPVLIDLPVDIQKEQIEFSYPKEVHIRSYNPTTQGHRGQIVRFTKALERAKRPVICLGGGIFSSNACTELVQLAERCQVPVVTTMMGISGIPTAHPLDYGMLGMHGTRSANTAVHEADLLVLVGSRAGDRAVTAKNVVEGKTQIIHVDIDPAEIGKNLGVRIPIVGDAKTVLQQVLEKVKPMEHKAWIERLNSLKKEPEAQEDKPVINPKWFLRRVSEKAPDDAVFVADVGQNQIWAANHYNIRKGRFLTSGGMGTMGYSLPAAIGAKMAAPERMVISSCGDGSFQMQMNELATMCSQNLDLKIIVLRNNRLGMVSEVQQNQYSGNCYAVFLDGSPDFAQLAAAYGVPSLSLSEPDKAEETIDAFLNSKGPCLLVCEVGETEPTL